MQKKWQKTLLKIYRYKFEYKNIFDIAELSQIKKFNKKNIVKGFTTNPSLMRKAGDKNNELYSKKNLKI